MKPKRTRAEYNLERKINAYIRRHKSLHSYPAALGGGYDTHGLMQAIANEFYLTTPQMSTAKTLVQTACAH